MISHFQIEINDNILQRDYGNGIGQHYQTTKSKVIDRNEIKQMFRLADS